MTTEQLDQMLREANWLEEEGAIVVREADENGDGRVRRVQARRGIELTAKGRRAVAASKRRALDCGGERLDGDAVPAWCSFCARTEQEAGRLTELLTRLGMPKVFCCGACAPHQAALLKLATVTRPNRAHVASAVEKL